MKPVEALRNAAPCGLRITESGGGGGEEGCVADEGPGEGVALGLDPRMFDIVDRHPVPLEVAEVDLEGLGDVKVAEDEGTELPNPRVVAKKDGLGFGDALTSTSISSKVSPASEDGGLGEGERI